MMTTQYPDVRDRDFFPVMKACKVLGICRTTLGKYERLGYISSMVRADGRKVFPGRELKRCFSNVSNQ